MDTYFQNLIPRLKEYGKKLNKVEQLVDRVWVVAESEGQSISYRFLRDKKLLITINGDVEEGEWNYLPPESLYLKFGTERKMFSQGFMLDEVLVLQKQTNDSTPFLLYDSKLGSLNELQEFLNRQFAHHNRLKKLGDYYVSLDEEYSVHQEGDSVYDNEFNLVTVPEVSTTTRIFELDNGRISKLLYRNKFQTDKGPIELLGIKNDEISKGDTLNSSDPVLFMKYQIKSDALYSSVTIENNIVVCRKAKSFRPEIIILVILLVVIAVVIYGTRLRV